MKQLIGLVLTLLFMNLWSTLAAASPQVCRYASEGNVQETWKKIRIQNAAGEFLAGADNFSEAISMGQSLLESEICRPQVQDCRMASEGIVGGVWMKHRIQMDGQMVFGADDIATALNFLSQLRHQGFCQ